MTVTRRLIGILAPPKGKALGELTDEELKVWCDAAAEKLQPAIDKINADNDARGPQIRGRS